MLPYAEICNFLATLAQSTALADAGSLADGYTALLDGLQAAMQALDEGCLWAAIWVERWQAACQNYTDRYGVRMD